MNSGIETGNLHSYANLAGANTKWHLAALKYASRMEGRFDKAQRLDER
jgi:hypothetical protein